MKFTRAIGCLERAANAHEANARVAVMNGDKPEARHLETEALLLREAAKILTEASGSVPSKRL